MVRRCVVCANVLSWKLLFDDEKSSSVHYKSNELGRNTTSDERKRIEGGLKEGK